LNDRASKGHSNTETDSSDITMGVHAEMAHPADGQSLIIDWSSNWALTITLISSAYIQQDMSTQHPKHHFIYPVETIKLSRTVSATNHGA
jgi:hypothetical protein